MFSQFCSYQYPVDPIPFQATCSSCYLSLIALSSTIIQVPHVQITSKCHPTNFTVDDHWILHQVHVLGGLCLIGDPSTLLILDTQWNLQFAMEEVFYFIFPSDGSPLGSHHYFPSSQAPNILIVTFFFHLKLNASLCCKIRLEEAWKT